MHHAAACTRTTRQQNRKGKKRKREHENAGRNKEIENAQGSINAGAARVSIEGDGEVVSSQHPTPSRPSSSLPPPRLIPTTTTVTEYKATDGGPETVEDRGGAAVQTQSRRSSASRNGRRTPSHTHTHAHLFDRPVALPLHPAEDSHSEYLTKNDDKKGRKEKQLTQRLGDDEPPRTSRATGGATYPWRPLLSLYLVSKHALKPSSQDNNKWKDRTERKPNSKTHAPLSPARTPTRDNTRAADHQHR